MFVLVTQADGSARRFPWLSYALAIGCLVAFSQLHGNTTFADRARADTVDYLHENPFVEVDPRYESVIPVEYAEALRRDFFEERRSEGLAPMSEFLMKRGQREFDDLLAYALSKVRMLPEWRYGIRGLDAPAGNWLAHVGIHETQFAMLLGIVMVLCLGIALEDGWGPAIFGPVVLAGAVVTAGASTQVGYFDAVGMPWFGASGVVATLLGAHFIRSLKAAPRLAGIVPMPGWLLIPVWLAAEYLGVRGVSSMDEFVSAPLLAQAAGFGVGAVVAGTLAFTRFETKMIDREQEAEELVSNPTLERAMTAKSAGRVEQAFEMLRAEYRRDPKNRDVALALWDVSIVVGKASRVVESILSVIEVDLQAGQVTQAVANWFAMTDEVENVSARPQLLVRVGEALLDEGHPEAAIAVLSSAVEGSKPVTTALARRIVRVARDLDPDLTRRAAEIALCDGQLGNAEREELTRLSSEVVPAPAPTNTPAQSAANPAPTLGPEGSHDASDTIETDTEVELDGAGSTGACARNDEDLSSIDPQAIDLEGLNQEPSGDPGDLDQQQAWNDPGLISDLEHDLEGEFDDFDDDVLAEAVMESGLADDTVTQVNVASAIPASEETVTEVVLATGSNDETTTAVNLIPAKRDVQVRDAVPVTLESKAIVIEVEGGTKTRLPYARVEALATAAVSGLGPKPIVVIDIIVNWQSAVGAMKVIRLRSDRFDPGQLAPGSASQLEALRKLIADLLQTTGATPLPNFNAATGSPFSVFDSVQAYHADVLGARDISSGV